MRFRPKEYSIHSNVHLSRFDFAPAQVCRSRTDECHRQKEESNAGSSVWMGPVTNGQEAKERALW